MSIRWPAFAIGVIFWLAVPARGGELSFFSPELAGASPEALSQDAERLATAEKADPYARLVTLLFLGDRLEAESRIHAAADRFREASRLCDELDATDYNATQEKARSAAVCALVEAERIAHAGPVLGMRRRRAMLHARDRALDADLTPDERRYLEGRLYSALIPTQGQDFAKALVALQFLAASRPDDGSVQYWLARAYERQGNRPRALEAYRASSDPRARLVLEREALGFEREGDGFSGGLRPGISYSPARGLGGQLEFHDDRLFDTRREVVGRIGMTTRGQREVVVSYTDGEIERLVELYFEGRFFDGVEDYYGLGMNSDGRESLNLRVRRTELGIGARAALTESLRLSVGWQSAGAQRTDDALGLSFGFQQGPVGELVFDTRDSFREPRRGTRIELRGYFPTQGLGSARTFQHWTIGLEHHQPLARLHHLHFLAAATWIDGSAAPFSAYPTLGGTINAPGIREYRYRDSDLGALSAEYDWRFSPTASLGAFLTAVTAVGDGPFLGTGVWKTGGGIAWTGHFSRHRSANPRLELANVGGEWVVNGLVSVAW